MKIAVGSKNSTKIQAVTEAAREYPMFEGAEIVPIEVKVDLYGHPKTLNEVVQGAMDRAKQAFQDCDYSFGIEGGLMDVPQAKSGSVEITICAIYDGKAYHLGFAPGFEWPKAVAKGIKEKGLDGSQALKAMGITDHDKVGTENGGIYILTNGRMDRTEYNKLAIRMAMVHLEHPKLY